jgi:hypothetical protein
MNARSRCVIRAASGCPQNGRSSEGIRISTYNKRGHYRDVGQCGLEDSEVVSELIAVKSVQIYPIVPVTIMLLLSKC